MLNTNKNCIFSYVIAKACKKNTTSFNPSFETVNLISPEPPEEPQINVLYKNVNLFKLCY